VFAGVLAGYAGAELHVNITGTVLYATGAAGDAGRLADLVAAGAAGIQRVDSSFSAPIAPNSGLDLSPDGRRALFSVADPTDGRSYLAIKDLAGGPAVRLTTDGTTNIRGVWHPDGLRVAWISDRGGRFEAWMTSADGSTAPELLASEDRNVYAIDFSPDGRWVLYRTDDVAPGRGDIYARRTSGDTAAIVTIAASDAEETSPAVSPDGRWVAYSEGQSGTKEVVVRPFPDVGGGRVQVSVGGGIEPAWSRDGRTLYYRSYSGEFIAAQVTSDAAFRVLRRSVVTRQSFAAFEANDDGRAWALMPDGRFLLVHRPGLEASESDRRLVLREGALSGSQGLP
jgi:dipeptidyl aminopeptidase/acylaminoacyl peptidase